MRLIGNILWLVIAGWSLFLSWIVAGVIACITIIGIPFGLQAFKVAFYVIWPFGRTLVHRADAGALSVVGNVVWVIFAGWWLAIITIAAGLLLCITIIGIPFGVACFKMLPIVFTPFGRAIVPSDSAEAAMGVTIGY